MKLIYSVTLRDQPDGPRSFEARALSSSDLVYIVGEFDTEQSMLYPFKTAISPEAIHRDADGQPIGIDPTSFYDDFERWLDEVGPRGALRFLRVPAGLPGEGLRAGFVFAYHDEAVLDSQSQVDIDKTTFRFALLVEPKILTAPGAPGVLQ